MIINAIISIRVSSINASWIYWCWDKLDTGFAWQKTNFVLEEVDFGAVENFEKNWIAFCDADLDQRFTEVIRELLFFKFTIKHIRETSIEWRFWLLCYWEIVEIEIISVSSIPSEDLHLIIFAHFI